MTRPKVTALVPVKWYRADYLRESVGSLLAQTRPHWRALVIHPRGAAPELEEVLGEAGRDRRVTLLEEEGRKLAGALNTGIRAAETEFTAILLGDDRWEPRAVEVLERAIGERPEADFFHSGRRYVDDRGNPISEAIPPRGEVMSEAFHDGTPVKHLLCWRRELALSIGGMDESLNSVGPDDYDFPWSMAEAGAVFAAVPECLYVYRDHRSHYRLTTHLPLSTHLRETERILRKHGVPGPVVRSRLAEARSTYLRQCLYSSRLDALIKRARRRDPGVGWRESYR